MQVAIRVESLVRSFSMLFIAVFVKAVSGGENVSRRTNK
jgi:hypothetical protein